ncbi:MAG TPA: hypothetical protein RMH99_22430, partial [Sandaracinaceae bacterium LLY-WYZ-13_1]|nr:hypothetical protein [Sandaracinaceae bacterium LLY-WYZ-13_1]
MSRVDVHPDDLLDAAHQGRLDAAGRARLERHVAHCTACAAEVALIEDFGEELAPGAGDDALLDRLVAGALGEAPPVEAPEPPAERAGGGSRRLIWMVASAALAVGAFGGAAAAMFAMHPQRGDEAPEAPAPAVAPADPALEPARRGRAVPAPPE